ncbi:hypothetical protein EYB25_007374 [Talaromyces marneffei]|uniref:Pentachlorophenol 4-monooxygenase, putative n=2 Tax=Talaromyces marneffei TaxID=37727 RepID=B6QN19_TALMQ|nr:pentachlorophenol 4-monooxygenase, putative [Talaromyces marneffei ATCC 18224]KAE8551140.1 hypothetical protein EYB25_007374 [Talaromyces marneffei]
MPSPSSLFETLSLTDSVKTDVFVCGGGPVGLITAYMLARHGISTYLVEKDDKEEQPSYGRACTLYPRTLEMMEHLELLDTMNQAGYIARNSVTFKDGKRVTARGWHKIFDRMRGGTYLDYCLNIRQKRLEDIFRKAYRKLGGIPLGGWKLVSFQVDHESADDHKVVVQIRNVKTDEELTVRAKYLVGADGGKSLVRELAKIPFNGTSTQSRWVRVDGDFETNMPDSDIGFASIESKNHGNVVWIQLEKGENRIGFALTDEMSAKYGNSMTEEDAKKEAIKAMEPFTLDIKNVSWWTVYCIQQRVAETFIADDRILLAGDACHTHSSGAAQGMNTGVHDAYNLSWKLAGTIKGWYGKEVLQTYDSERRSTAEYLIELDKTLSTLISGRIPERYQATHKDANELFSKIVEETAQFNIGLGIQYQENIINKPPSAGMISAGSRAPDALVYPPGSHFPVRLFTLSRYIGKWTIILFAGQYELTRAKLPAAAKELVDLALTLPRGIVRLMTIFANSMAAVPSTIPKAGFMYYDQDRSAHLAYSISPKNGAVVVLRPDGLLGYATTLGDVGSVSSFLMELIKARCR